MEKPKKSQKLVSLKGMEIVHRKLVFKKMNPILDMLHMIFQRNSQIE